MQSMILIVSNLAVISALLWFFDVPYRQYRIDLLRHRLFDVRDALISAARDGAISYRNPAYKMTRQIINGMIRFSQDVSFWQLLLMLMTQRIWEMPREPAQFARQLAGARLALTADQRKVIDDVLNRAHADLLSHMAHTSLCIFPFAIGSKAIATMLSALGLENPRVALGNPVLNWVDCQAYAIGGIHAVPASI